MSRVLFTRVSERYACNVFGFSLLLSGMAQWYGMPKVLLHIQSRLHPEEANKGVQTTTTTTTGMVTDHDANNTLTKKRHFSLSIESETKDGWVIDIDTSDEDFYLNNICTVSALATICLGIPMVTRVLADDVAKGKMIRGRGARWGREVVAKGMLGVSKRFAICFGLLAVTVALAMGPSALAEHLQEEKEEKEPAKKSPTISKQLPHQLPEEEEEDAEVERLAKLVLQLLLLPAIFVLPVGGLLLPALACAALPSLCMGSVAGMVVARHAARKQLHLQFLQQQQRNNASMVFGGNQPRGQNNLNNFNNFIK